MTTWMNEDEIAEAVERFSDPDLNNLRRGAHTLRRLMRWTNEHSDGWPYWKKPAAAAGKLMELLDTKTREQSHRGDGLTDITDAELTKALSPIKAFLTREGVDHALILEEARSRLALDDLPGGVNNPHPGVPAEAHPKGETLTISPALQANVEKVIANLGTETERIGAEVYWEQTRAMVLVPGEKHYRKQLLIFVTDVGDGEPSSAYVKGWGDGVKETRI